MFISVHDKIIEKYKFNNYGWGKNRVQTKNYIKELKINDVAIPSSQLSCFFLITYL